MKKPIYNKETGRYELDGIDFDGHFHEWRFEYVPKTYLKESELSGDQWRKGGNVKIYLNDECILKEFCREPERALMLMAKGLHELQCFFEISFFKSFSSWKEEIVGRKVWIGGIPSIVINVCDDGEIMLRRADGKDFLPDLYPSLVEEDGTYDDEWGDKDRVHILDKRINWNIKQ